MDGTLDEISAILGREEHPASKEIASECLQAVALFTPSIREPGEIVRALVAQVTGTVRWRESVVFMADAGVSSFYEVGAGKVLSGLINRLANGATTAAIGSPEEVAAFKAGRNR